MKNIDDPFDESEEQRIIRPTALSRRRLPPSSHTTMLDTPAHQRDQVMARWSLRDMIIAAREHLREAKRMKKQIQRERRKQSTGKKA